MRGVDRASRGHLRISRSGCKCTIPWPWAWGCSRDSPLVHGSLLSQLRCSSDGWRPQPTRRRGPAEHGMDVFVPVPSPLFIPGPSCNTHSFRAVKPFTAASAVCTSDRIPFASCLKSPPDFIAAVFFLELAWCFTTFDSNSSLVGAMTRARDGESYHLCVITALPVDQMFYGPIPRTGCIVLQC